MHRSAGSFVKGMTTGIVAGMTIATASSIFMKTNKKMKKGSRGAVRAVTDFISNVHYMMK